MTESRAYKAKPARRALRYWLQPFVLLFLVFLLCRLLPVSALLYESREIRPLPGARAFYVSIDPDYAMEILRASMQTWRRSRPEGEGSDNMSMEAVELSEPLGPPAFLKQGSLYPGVWTPTVITPLAQSLPSLLHTSDIVSRYDNRAALKRPQSGVYAVADAALQGVQFTVPTATLSALPGVGRCRFYVETAADGSVAHVLRLESSIKDVTAVERALYLGQAQGPAQGEVEIRWRNP